MAEAEKNETSDPKDMWVKPAVTFVKSIGLLLDVATLMIRMLIYTLAYDSPLGKPEAADDRPIGAKS